MSKNKKFDIKTSNNFLFNYKNEIIKFNQENIALTERLSDLKTTLELNQSILLDFFSKTIGESEEIVELVKTTKKLWEENEQLVNEKNRLEFKAFKLQETIEDTPTEIREELSIIQKENIKMKQMLVTKDALILKLSKSLEKARSYALFKVTREEIMVNDPTKTNLALNNELIHTSSILAKVTQMNHSIRIKGEKMERELKLLQEEFMELKRDKDNKRLEKVNLNASPNNKRNANRLPISTTGPLPKGNNDGLDKSKKVMNTFFAQGNNNSSSSNSEEENSEEESNEEFKAKIFEKNKRKKLELLKQDYNALKKETEKNELQIQKFKMVYNDMKDKIKTMNPVLKTHYQTERRFKVKETCENISSKK